mmetsp:Transcript_29155/g.75020  ORF Transcript_29155/g.75020 Transcript_29155/m.75020 type:complete len:358 (+) Transcript_29155:290-1363(+)|eukprot:CAMPEP_0113895020 /NCGR_PEP_ID=MMETSP0780_2-20120614/17096_1 /TAXON_ID=652834 /ORGANISM="Palpitomonas bilix" /LENGTH=357 /DNA_ID=CAMNT_0000885735 /DNA_START=190 /DNA_END=1263 /DNA_ORIENTATION=- /assembly_acc=CAM_ASM_000599
MAGSKGEKEKKGAAKTQQTIVKSSTHQYQQERVIGTGSFGVVQQATCVETGDIVAIKRVFQDKRFKNRELQIMQMLKHPSVVALKDVFYTNEKEDVYLNLVLEYVPETVYRVSRNYTRLRQQMPMLNIKLYMYQLARALAYIHSFGVCHRDIKPQNLLVDPSAHVLKLCDFGSAKVLVKGEPNIAYICSRYYRAPELIFGATQYDSKIDVWSYGCVFAELIVGQPLFPGDSNVDQLVEIIKVLGTPKKEEILAMNENYTEFKFPNIKPHPWSKVFRSKAPQEAIDLLSKILVYPPKERLSPLEICAHAFFDELRDPNAKMPGGGKMPDFLFEFTPEELKVDRELIEKKLIPPHARQD